MTSTDKIMPQRAKWRNLSTGDEIEGYTVLREVKRRDFEIVYAASLFNIMEVLGGARYKILSYILANKSYDNTLMITTTELARKTETSRDTVDRTLKLLKQCGMIKTRTGGIIVNPLLMNKGTKKKEEWIFERFQIFDEDEKSKEPKPLLDFIEENNKTPEKKRARRTKKKTDEEYTTSMALEEED